jgi:pimeloyl-ACP methyl ester carboxylesterase
VTPAALLLAAALRREPCRVPELPEYWRRRDVVLVDRRGTGGSNGLPCAWDEMRSRLEQMHPPNAVADCRRTLEARADLTRYTTDAAADDLDEVRAALGYPSPRDLDAECLRDMRAQPFVLPSP